MIELSFEAACMLYLTLALISIIGVWLSKHFTSKKEILSFTTKHFTCEFCKGSYIADPTKRHVRCPQCQCLNTPKQEKKK